MDEDCRIFEIYETGDPYSKAWDCTEYKDVAEREKGIGVFRGDINGMYTKHSLVYRLRKLYPGCKIYHRDSGRLCTIGV
jgi:hypothetical protein